MSEVAVRLLMVVAVVVVAIIGSWVFNRRDKGSARISQQLFGPGVYLFSSTSCLSCEEARTVMVEALGEDGFEELSWEANPDHFRSLGIDKVPVVLTVKETGRSALHPGVPERAAKLLSP